MSNITIIAHKGTAFASQGSGRFVKDVLRVGLWHHPVTGEEVDVTRTRLETITEDSNRWLKNGNKIPFPDGHSWKTLDNLGFWQGPFMIQDGDLYAGVTPKSKKALEKIEDGSLDSVSVVMEKNYVDTEGNQYDEVITQICGTNYPVVTKQKGFVKLSRDGNQYDVVVMVPKLKKIVSADQDALDRLAMAINGCGGSKADRVITALQGKPGKNFEECVSIMMKERGVDQKRAEGLCASLARRAGEKLARPCEVIAALKALKV